MLEKLAPTVGGKTFVLPEPTLCPDCRQQRRQAAVNQLHLYKRTCDLTGRSIVSNFHASTPYTVYAQDAWWEDAWDPLFYGREFDFSRSFFEQYKELCLAVPHPSLTTAYQYDENCDYTNYAGKNKDCYLIFDSDECRDCYYCYSVNGCANCLDCLRARRCELCYEVIDSVNCYGSSYLQDCDNCSESAFLKSCIGCKNCLMCVNLKNAEHCIENRQVTKEEFEATLAHLNTRGAIEAAKLRFEDLKREHPHKSIHAIQCENVTGDYLLNCKNADGCYDSEGLWDCRHVYQAFMPVKDGMDLEEPGEGERLYECSSCGYSAQNMYFSASTLECQESFYESFCFHCNNVFGCVGLRRKQYCILNTQYTKQEYEVLVPKIIEHMQRTGEWGEFFPMELSAFPYNESIAQDWYPLTKEEVLAQGLSWRDDETKTDGTGAIVPDSIAETSDDILQATLVCENLSRAYKIIPQELQFYRSRNLPVPTRCFLSRHKARLAMRNPRRLHDRTCSVCQTPIQTTYAPDRPETILCETCYRKAVY